MHPERMNQISIAITQDIPENEICETDEERKLYRLMKKIISDPANKGMFLDMVKT